MSIYNNPREFDEVLFFSFELSNLTVKMLENGENSMKWYEKLTQEELYTVLKLKNKKNLTDIEKLLVKVVDIALEQPLETQTVSNEMAKKIERELSEAAKAVKATNPYNTPWNTTPRPIRSNW